MGELGRLVEDYKDRAAAKDPLHRRPNNADIGRVIGVGRSTVHHWTQGKMPGPEHLGPLARALGVPYPRVLAAALSDSGYLAREADLSGYHAAATTHARGSLAPEGVITVVTEALETYFRRADKILDTQHGRGRDALLDELRTELKRHVASRLAEDRPSSAIDVG